MPFLFAGIFLLAGSVILLEVSLTRIFAMAMWHHLAYMVISVALLGFGAAGSFLTAKGSGKSDEDSARSISRWATAYGLLVLVAFFAVSRTRVDVLRIWDDASNLALLFLICAIVFAPFLCAGCAIGLALTRYAKDVNRMYFWDLFGSAVGGGASVWVMSSVGAAASVITAGFLGTLSAVVFGLGAKKKPMGLALPGLVIGATVAGLYLFGPLGDAWQVPFARGKEFDDYELSEIERYHSSTAEVEVAPVEHQRPMLGGEFGLQWSLPLKKSSRLVGQDGSAPTVLYEDAVEYADFDFLSDTQAASAYLSRKAAKPDAAGPKALVIGVGGGADVMLALHHGASRVKAVEINSAMLRLVREEYDDYLGGLFRPGAHADSDKIELVHGEGRSVLRSSDEKFDVIQMSGVDSFTALSTGAYTLSESYLYTVDAVKDFYGHLEEDGYINYSRFILSYPKKPRETLRLANIAFEALSQLGVEDPASHILVYRAENWASTMIKQSPFTRAEIEVLEQHGARNGFWGLVYDPLAPNAPSTEPRVGFERRAMSLFVRQLPGRTLPLDYTRPRPELIGTLTQAFRHAYLGEEAEKDAQLATLVTHVEGDERATALAVLETRVDTLARDHRALDKQFERTRSDFRTLMRGTPAERAAFVEDYAYDLSPCTDDDPFFFNYYKFGQVAEEDSGEQDEPLYTPDFPVGHVVLMSSLVAITILAAILILLPLRFVSREKTPWSGRLSTLSYFGALGAGFMLVEIVLMQKLVLFLGHPTYAITVVLTTILATAGLGSLLSSRVRVVDGPVLWKLAIVVPILILAEAAAVHYLLPSMLGLPFEARVGVAVAVLAPLGLALGMPFPLGLRRLESLWPELLPWAWAINAFLSVFSSIFCIVLAMQTGFTAVLFVGAAIYLVGLPGLARRIESAG